MSENTQTVVERARDEAESIFPWHTSHGIDPRDEPVRRQREAFDIGATFAATITPEQVEAAARALYGERLRINGIGREWSGIGKPQRDSWRAMAHAAFTAAGFQIEADFPCCRSWCSSSCSGPSTRSCLLCGLWPRP